MIKNLSRVTICLIIFFESFIRPDKLSNEQYYEKKCY